MLIAYQKIIDKPNVSLAAARECYTTIQLVVTKGKQGIIDQNRQRIAELQAVLEADQKSLKKKQSDIMRTLTNLI